MISSYFGGTVGTFGIIIIIALIVTYLGFKSEEYEDDTHCFDYSDVYVVALTIVAIILSIALMYVTASMHNSGWW